MKRAVYIISILFIAAYTEGFSQNNNDKHKISSDTLSVDSTGYELIILDPGFELWLITRPPKEFHSKEYYQQMNRLYVSEWNYRFSTGRDHGEYDSYIDYEPQTDYGLDLNYKLYYYFKYFEEKHRTKLYPFMK